GTAYVNVRAQDGTNCSGNFKVRVLKAEEYKKIDPTYEESTVPLTTTKSRSRGESVLMIEGPDTAAAGEKISLNVAGGNTEAGVFWFSSDESAAKIDADGQVVIAEDAKEDTVVIFTAILNDGNSTAAIHEVKITAAPAPVVTFGIQPEETAVTEDDILSQLVMTFLNGPEEAATEEGNGETVSTETAAPAEVLLAAAETETPGDDSQGETESEPTEEPKQEEGQDDEDAGEIVETTEVPADTQTETPDGTSDDGQAAGEPTETAEPVSTEGTDETAEPAGTDAAAEETTETRAPVVSEIVFTDYESETARFELFAGSELVIEPEKITISPFDADWSEMTFEIENEAIAVLESDEAARILEEGLKIKGLAAGMTVLKIKAGDYEKEIPVVISAAPEYAVETPAPQTDEEQPIVGMNADPGQTSYDTQAPEQTEEVQPTEEPVDEVQPTEEPVEEVQPTPEPTEEVRQTEEPVENTGETTEENEAGQEGGSVTE
ncbi:MAG: hypothetical protein IKP86_09630, partial [Anaerolineaceae bacterium]|nr:hypothetical protein [Anaerolineaceae bacterium]